jgi:hypothetical protein
VHAGPAGLAARHEALLRPNQGAAPLHPRAADAAVDASSACVLGWSLHSIAVAVATLQAAPLLCVTLERHSQGGPSVTCHKAVLQSRVPSCVRAQSTFFRRRSPDFLRSASYSDTRGMAAASWAAPPPPRFRSASFAGTGPAGVTASQSGPLAGAAAPGFLGTP